MKKAFRAALLLVLLAGAAAAQKTTDWIKYTSVEGRYSVSLPSDPKISQQETVGADGVKFPQYMAASADGIGALIVAYFDLPASAAFSLDKGRDGLISGMKAALISEDSISLGGASGRQWKLSAESGGVLLIIRAQMYTIGSRVYLLECVFPKSEDAAAVEAKAGRLFDSFKVNAN